MKRILTMLLCLCFFFPLSHSARAEGTLQNAGDLYEMWMNAEGVPDYISGVWSTDGSSENLTFALVEGEEGEAGKQEILDLVIDDSTVTFATQTYSRNYLYAIMEDVNTYFEKDLGFTCAGPNEYENRVDIEIHVGHQENPDTLAAVEELQEKYGGAVHITFTDTVFSTTVEIVTEAQEGPMLVMANPQYQRFPLDLMLIGCAVLLCFLLLIQRQRSRVAALQDGETANIADPLTSREVERRVIETAPEFSSGLDARIYATIESISDQKS